MSLNYYTFYLVTGQRKVFLGTSFQDAYCNNQTYSEGQVAIAFQEEGITDNYYWDSESSVWVDKEDLIISYEQLMESPSKYKQVIKEDFSKINYIIIQYPNNDRISLSLCWKEYIFGWCNLVIIKYEKHLTEEIIYEYYHAYEINIAIDKFFDKIMSNVPPVFIRDEDNNRHLEDIYNNLSPDKIYVNLTPAKEIWLLGCLINRLINHSDIDKHIKRKFIVKSTEVKHSDINMLLSQIDFYTDKLLITNEGQNNHQAQQILSSYFKFKFKVLEQDSFGPLIMSIETYKGIITYG